MIYKTLKLQIYKPGKRKCEILDAAMLGYARALQTLLDAYREKICEIAVSGGAFTKSTLLSLIGKPLLKELNVYGIEPFKDSIKMEFAAIVSAYIMQFRKNQRTRFPCVYETPERSEALLETLAGETQASPRRLTQLEREFRSAVVHESRCHPLYFGRYDTCRDYCLLYDEYTGRFYAKLYLLNAGNRLQPEGRSYSLHLREVSREKKELAPSKGPERYLIFPLSFGREQLSQLREALENPDILHTARLQKKDGRYYLLVHLECGQKQDAAALSTMGIARNASGGLHYTVCAIDGRILKQGTLDSAAPGNQKLYVLANSIVQKAKQHQSQSVMEAEGGFSDDLSYKRTGTALDVASYRKLTQIVSYKLQEAGLCKPILVSARGLYCTCPECHCRTRGNHTSTRLFICVNCGYASVAEGIGSLNLARMPSKYKSDKIPVLKRETEKGLLFYNKALAFEYLMKEQGTDYTRVYYELSLFARSQQGFEKNSKKYAMLRKLREAPDIRDAIRIENAIRE